MLQVVVFVTRVRGPVSRCRRCLTLLASAGPQVVGKHRDDRCRPPPHGCGIIVRLAGLSTQHGLLRLQSRPASFERDCFMIFDSGRSDHHSIHVQGVHVSDVQRAAEPLSVHAAQETRPRRHEG